MNTTNVLSKRDKLVIAVVALGYFVDVYDILLFSIVRTKSLNAIGITDPHMLTDIGLSLLNWQLFGMLVGGIAWGIIADKFGRRSILFGSIILYSLATFGNAFVTNVDQYTIMRFIAGLGLAGELGVGIALIAETVPKNMRTISTTIVASFGMLGGVAAAFIAGKMNWQTSYMVGGLMGLILFIFRFNVPDSVLFAKMSKGGVSRGNFFKLLATGKSLKKYLLSIFAGAPTYVFAGLFITLSPEYGKALGLENAPSAGTAVIYFYIFLTVFDMLSGLISKYLKSRKKVLYLFLLFQSITVIIFLYIPLNSASDFYFRCGLVGGSLGFWTIIVTNAAEQFGTNLRATVSSSVPNLARAIAIPFILLFKEIKPSMGIVSAGAAIAGLSILIAFVSVVMLKERFENDLDFTE
jgi:MFS family permease